MGFSKFISRLLIALVSAFTAAPAKAHAESSATAASDAKSSSTDSRTASRADYAHSSSGEASNVDFHVSPNIDFTILSNVDTGFRYTYQVQPAFQSGIYTRLDRWTPHVDIHISDVRTTIEPGAEIIYLRQFASKAEAVKAKPHFNPHELPFNSANALRMSPGEVVMMPVHLDLLVGPDGSVNEGPLQLYGRAQYVMRGLYQIQALRLADQRVRLRLIATRQRGLEAEVGARLSLDFFNVNILNKAFHTIFGTHIGSYQFDDGVKSLVMADYIFDLSNETARDAYNHLLSSDRLLTNASLVNPANGIEKIQKMFVADLDNVDTIAQADRALAPDARRIVQIFKGHTQQKDQQWNLGVNLLSVFAFRRMTDSAPKNSIVFLDSDNNTSNFFAPTQTVEKHLRLLWGLRSEWQTRRASLIAPTNSQGAPTSMGDYVVSYEIKDKHMGKSETERVLQKLKFNIAPSIIDQLNIAPLLTAKSYKNARVFAQVIFNESAFREINGLTRVQLIERLSHHLSELGDGDHANAVAKFAAALEVTLDSSKTPAERIKTFMELQKKRYFRAVGTGCLMSLLPQDRLADFVSVYVRVDASSFKDKVEASFGKSEIRGVVRASEFIQNMLNNGTFDLRLETFGSYQVPGATAAGSSAAGASAVISLKDLATPPALVQ